MQMGSHGWEIVKHNQTNSCKQTVLEVREGLLARFFLGGEGAMDWVKLDITRKNTIR